MQYTKHYSLFDLHEYYEKFNLLQFIVRAALAMCTIRSISQIVMKLVVSEHYHANVHV
jgi:hypothetical protein